jgi:hypothetical protein
MHPRIPCLGILLLVALLTAHCGSGSSPSETGSLGNLFFSDSGCSCAPPPLPPVMVFVDGTPFTFPLFGQLSVQLSAGQHSWSLIAGDPNPTRVLIVAGQTVNVALITNNGCAEGCDSSAASKRLGAVEGWSSPRVASGMCITRAVGRR